MASFNVIEHGLAWKVGSSERVRIVVRPWVGCSTNYLLPLVLVEFLNANGKYTLNQVVDLGSTSIWAQGWESVAHLYLPNELSTHWQHYTNALNTSLVRICEEENTLRWIHALSRDYILNMDYLYHWGQRIKKPKMVVEENLEIGLPSQRKIIFMVHS